MEAESDGAEDGIPGLDLGIEVVDKDDDARLNTNEGFIELLEDGQQQKGARVKLGQQEAHKEADVEGRQPVRLDTCGKSESGCSHFSYWQQHPSDQGGPPSHTPVGRSPGQAPFLPGELPLGHAVRLRGLALLDSPLLGCHGARAWVQDSSREVK